MKRTAYLKPETEAVPFYTEQMLYTTSVPEGNPGEGEPEGKETTFEDDWDDWEEEDVKDALDWFNTPIKSRSAWER